MLFEEFKELLEKELKEIHINLSQEQYNKLYIYE